MGEFKPKEIIAFAIYTPDGGGMYVHELFTKQEIEKVRIGEDPIVENWACKIVIKDPFECEDHT